MRHGDDARPLDPPAPLGTGEDYAAACCAYLAGRLTMEQLAARFEAGNVSTERPKR